MIDHRGMADAREWSDFIVLPLSLIGVEPRRLDNPDHWKQWAFDLIQDPKLQIYQVPDPRVYADWREWVERFNQVVPYE